MCFAVIATGYQPCCALDSTDGAEVRVSKIAGMIGACDWGIHDISRVEVAAGRSPRFNMPMELGLHLGARLLGQGRHRRKRALILDAVPHRYDAALSDISGQDIEIHEEDPDVAIQCVRNWLSEHRRQDLPRLPGARALQGDYRRFNADIATILQASRLDPLDELPHSDYVSAVYEWIRSQAATAPRG